MPCCPRSVDATWGRTKRRSSLTSVYRPGKVGCLCCFSLFCPPTSKGHIFSTARPIWVNFMSNQRVFRALRRNRAILEEWTKKEGPFFLMWGFSGLKIPGMALLVTWGTGLRTGARFVCHVVLDSVDATCGSMKRRFKFQPRLSPRQSRLFVPVFRCFALQLQKAISFQPLGRFG